MGSISIDSAFNFYFGYICTREETRTYKTMDFNPEVEDEVIRAAASHKLDGLLVNPSNKVCRDSKQTKTPTQPFQIGDSLRYTN